MCCCGAGAWGEAQRGCPWVGLHEGGGEGLWVHCACGGQAVVLRQCGLQAGEGGACAGVTLEAGPGCAVLTEAGRQVVVQLRLGGLRAEGRVRAHVLFCTQGWAALAEARLWSCCGAGCVKAPASGPQHAEQCCISIMAKVSRPTEYSLYHRAEASCPVCASGAQEASCREEAQRGWSQAHAYQQQPTAGRPPIIPNSTSCGAASAPCPTPALCKGGGRGCTS